MISSINGEAHCGVGPAIIIIIVRTINARRRESPALLSARGMAARLNLGGCESKRKGEGGAANLCYASHLIVRSNPQPQSRSPLWNRLSVRPWFPPGTNQTTELADLIRSSALFSATRGPQRPRSYEV